MREIFYRAGVLADVLGELTLAAARHPPQYEGTAESGQFIYHPGDLVDVLGNVAYAEELDLVPYRGQTHEAHGVRSSSGVAAASPR